MKEADTCELRVDLGARAHLIRSAAIRAMLGHTEHIDREGLDSVLIDYAAQASAQRSAG